MRLVLLGLVCFVSSWPFAAVGEVAASSSRQVEIRLDLQGPTPESLSGQLLLVPLDAEQAESLGSAEIRLDLEALVRRIELPSAGVWKVCAWLRGWWSPCREVRLEPESEPTVHVVTLSLWPSGRIEGRVSRRAEASEEDSPETTDVVRAQFSPSNPLRSGLPTSEARCPVDEEGRWGCSVPSGALDLTLRPVGFVPSYRWDVEVERGEVVDLGTLPLRRGASLVGRVEVETGDLRPGECVAALTPAVAGGPGTVGAQRLSEVRYEATVDARGFFQIVDIAAGSYVLEVTQPGLAPSRVFPVEIHEESETVLGDSVELRRPLRIRLHVDPPVDASKRPWSVSLAPASDVGGRVDTTRPIDRPTDDRGVVEFPGQTPGVFVLRIEDSTGQRFYFEPSFEVWDALGADRWIEIPMVSLLGEVWLGDDPLAEAELSFGGRSGALRVEMTADEEGRFYGVLPRSGRWRVELEAEEPELRSRVEVEIQEGEGGYAELRIELPATELFGTVVDGEGQPVAEAEVGVQSGADSANAMTDDAGEYRILGFEPGQVAVRARKRSAEGMQTADTQVVTVSEELAYGPLQLRLIDTREIQGQLLTPDGQPAAGAVVEVSSPEPALFIDSARTDMAGRFAVRVREGSRRLQVIAAYPGRPLLVTEVDGREPLALRLESLGGDLALDLSWLVDSRETSVLLYKEGVPISMGTLWRWARMQGRTTDPELGALELPSMPAAGYSLCTVDHRAPFSVSSDGADRAADGCVDGFLTPGSALVLTAEPAGTSKEMDDAKSQ